MSDPGCPAGARTLGSLDQHRSVLPQFWRSEGEIKVWAGPCSFLPLSASGAPAVPGPVAASLQSVPGLHVAYVAFSSSLSVSPLMRAPLTGFRAPQIQNDLSSILTLITSAKTLFPNKSHSEFRVDMNLGGTLSSRCMYVFPRAYKRPQRVPRTDTRLPPRSVHPQRRNSHPGWALGAWK